MHFIFIYKCIYCQSIIAERLFSSKSYLLNQSKTPTTPNTPASPASTSTSTSTSATGTTTSSPNTLNKAALREQEKQWLEKLKTMSLDEKRVLWFRTIEEFTSPTTPQATKFIYPYRLLILNNLAVTQGYQHNLFKFRWDDAFEKLISSELNTSNPTNYLKSLAEEVKSATKMYPPPSPGLIQEFEKQTAAEAPEINPSSLNKYDKMAMDLPDATELSTHNQLQNSIILDRTEADRIRDTILRQQHYQEDMSVAKRLNVLADEKLPSFDESSSSAIFKAMESNAKSSSNPLFLTNYGALLTTESDVVITSATKAAIDKAIANFSVGYPAAEREQTRIKELDLARQVVLTRSALKTFTSGLLVSVSLVNNASRDKVATLAQQLKSILEFNYANPRFNGQLLNMILVEAMSGCVHISARLDRAVRALIDRLAPIFNGTFGIPVLAPPLLEEINDVPPDFNELGIRRLYSGALSGKIIQDDGFSNTGIESLVEQAKTIGFPVLPSKSTTPPIIITRENLIEEVRLHAQKILKICSEDLAAAAMETRRLSRKQVEDLDTPLPVADPRLYGEFFLFIFLIYFLFYFIIFLIYLPNFFHFNNVCIFSSYPLNSPRGN